MNNSILKRRLAQGAGHAFAAILLAGGALGFSSCQDDLLTGTPSWLGSSIYEELERRGNFEQTLALINDPDLSETNYPEMLRRTGSMTLFVADDAAWQRFLGQRGLSSISQLSKAEKKNLLKSSMINNAYLIELLSNTAGNPPTEGACFRRASRVDIADSIPVMTAGEYPVVNPARTDAAGAQVDYWSGVRDRASLHIYKGDAYRTDGENTAFVYGATPMVHFLPDFMAKNNLTDEDLRVITNGEATDASATSYINGKRVVEQDITCQNGYIHILSDVPQQLPNMAEIIHSKPQFSIFSELLDRYSYPDFMGLNTSDGHTDSLFVKRYFNEGKSDNKLTQFVLNGTTVKPSGTLRIDPGWNRYAIDTNSGDTYQNDGAAMMVPTDEWMRHYISPQGEGAAIGLKYGYDWRNVPDNVVLPFLNNCMQVSFVASSPSKFDAVKNTASEEMGITVADVDSSFMACNGVVYQLGKVFVAPQHQSVFFPAILRSDEDLGIVHQAVANTVYKGTTNGAYWTLYEYDAYVNSMGSTYSLILPRDRAFSPQAGEYTLPDPFSITPTDNAPLAYRFSLNPSQTYFPVAAQAFNVEADSLTGQWVMTDNRAATNRQPTSQNTTQLALVNNRLEDILENIIIVHGGKHAQTFHEGQDIYLNKAGAPIKVRFEGGRVTGLAGSWHASHGWWIPVSEELVFDQRESGNGVAYIVDSIPYTTNVSPYAALHDLASYPEYRAFAELMAPSCSFLGETFNSGRQVTVDYAFSTMGNFHYTIYVPQNSAIEDLVASKRLPTWETYEEWAALITELSEYSTDLQNQLRDYENRQKSGAVTPEQFDAFQAQVDARQEEIDRLSQDAAERQETVRTVIENFLRYHIQDGSVYIGGADTVGVYETAAIDTAMNRFRRLNLSNVARTFSVTDAEGHQARVINGPASNVMTRQYLFTKADRQIYGSSYVVLHLIDRALTFGPEALLPEDFPQPAYPEWLQEWMNANQPNLARQKRR